MEKMKFPLRVTVMDDDFHALMWNTALVMRDPRTTVIAEAESPEDLIKRLKRKTKPDLVIVDVECAPESISLDETLSAVADSAPEAVIVCTSQYGETEMIKKALKYQVRGFLLKSEVRMAIVPAIMKAAYGELVVTPSIAEVLGEDFYDPALGKLHVLPAWKPNPRLTPQIIKSFWLRVFFGMRASLAADELYLETATIERYINQAYKVLTDGWADESYLFDVDLTSLSPEDQAFVWFTLPPRRN